MKYILFLAFNLSLSFCFAQETEWIKTEGEITEITIHRSKRTRESAIVKFYLEDGTEQLGGVDLFRLPVLGSMKSVGDKITINYNKDNPYRAETVIGSLLTKYGMYVLILLGIIFSLKPILNYKKSINVNT